MLKPFTVAQSTGLKLCISEMFVSCGFCIYEWLLKYYVGRWLDIRTTAFVDNTILFVIYLKYLDFEINVWREIHFM